MRNIRHYFEVDMKVYVHKYRCCATFLGFSEMEKIERYDCIGTLDLPIEPVKKEVVKEIEENDLYIDQIADDNGEINIRGWAPLGAYDIKLYYKVKE